MRIACPIRVDPGKAKYLSQSLDKTRFIGLEGLRESAIYVKHHEFHGKVRMSPNEMKLSRRAKNKERATPKSEAKGRLAVMLPRCWTEYRALWYRDGPLVAVGVVV